jgi:alpha-amylase/alpha-mannosidase (GH57 family)
MKRYICIHGHFYQPPRENPWLEEVELQDSAAPFHDWNERITAQCYGPNASSRILDGEQRIIDIVNNYAKMSFNFGPTLLSWMEKNQPATYEAILAADALSLKRFSGHGSAIAQVYNHMIMPLANRRDKITQATWGVEDFRKRFGRAPEGMWLPETAVDDESLEILVDLGVSFTILSPRQAARVRRIEPEEGPWQDVSSERIDPTTAYRRILPSGRSISLFFYDGPISQELAFGDLLSSGESFLNHLMSAFTAEGREWPQLVHIATDGETYGHHHQQGEMALSYCLYLMENNPEVTLTNYGEYLEHHPPQFEVDIFQNSSWSCVHGVERWRADCGCNSGMHPQWNQAWRQPLRTAMNWLRDTLATIYEEYGARYFDDPWAARDRYIEVILDRSPEKVRSFLEAAGSRHLPHPDMVNALQLLEMQRFAQLIFTSCGWFFDDISGIENVQVLQYALRSIQIAEEITGSFIEEEFIQRLERAPSNVLANGSEVFVNYVQPAKVDMHRVGAHYAISSLFEQHPAEFDFACYTALSEMHTRLDMGRSSMVTGKTRIASRITLQEVVISFAALHLGDHNVTCGVNLYKDVASHRRMEKELKGPFERGDITEAIRMIDGHFGANTYSVYHLFRDQQRKVVKEILTPAYQTAEASYRQVFEDSYPILNFLNWLYIPPPRLLLDAAETIVNTDLSRLFEHDKMDVYRLGQLIKDAKKFHLTIDTDTLSFSVSFWVNARMTELKAQPDNTQLIDVIKDVLSKLLPLNLALNLAESQNIYFSLGKDRLPGKRQAADRGDHDALRWIEAFTELGGLLKVKLT